MLAPRALLADDFRLVEPEDRLGQGDVVGSSHASHGRLDPGVGQAVCVADRNVRLASVAAVNQLVEILSRTKSLLDSIP